MNFVSNYEHRIPKAEEAVFLFHSYLIRGHGLLIAVEGGNEHDEGAFGQVEVGDEAIDAVELDARIQEDGGVSAASLDLAVLGGDGFQCAAARGADCDDAVPGGLGLPDALGGLLADGVPLAVHLVVGDLILHHGAEGAEADVQGHFSDADALGADGIHQLRGEVQTGRRGGGASKLLGVDGLILALVFELLGDIGRQRHFAKFVQLFIKRLGVIIKCNELVAVFQRLVHHGRQGAVAEAHLGAGLHPLAGLGKALPLVALDLTQQQQLADRAGRLLDAHDAGGQDLGVVDDQQVARLQIFRQVVEDAVLDAVVFLAQDHQPGRVTRVRRFLRDEFFG